MTEEDTDLIKKQMGKCGGDSHSLSQSQSPAFPTVIRLIC